MVYRPLSPKAGISLGVNVDVMCGGTRIFHCYNNAKSIWWRTQKEIFCGETNSINRWREMQFVTGQRIVTTCVSSGIGVSQPTIFPAGMYIPSLNSNTKEPTFESRFFYMLKLSRSAVPTGFEPAISALTGPHVRPLHHGTNSLSGRKFTMTARRCQYEL